MRDHDALQHLPALRLDVTALATTPALLTFEDTTDLDDALEPVNTDNPLALMIYFMLINAPGITVTGLGVDAVSADYPDGTDTAYARALTFLEAQEVYALAPGTQEPVVHQLFITHVDTASDPDAKGERIVFINPEMPGAQNPKFIFEPSRKIFDSIEDNSVIKMVNVVPDFGSKSCELTEYLTTKGIVVGAGHVAASCDQWENAIKAGLKYCIHFTNGPTGGSYKVFNGGGSIEAVLKFDEIYSELMLDGYHINPT